MKCQLELFKTAVLTGCPSTPLSLFDTLTADSSDVHIEMKAGHSPDWQVCVASWGYSHPHTPHASN
jgi:hypothetical protein